LADPELLKSLIDKDPELFVALDNCRHQVVLCGTEAAIGRVLESLADKPAVCQRLPMGRAYHTPYFDKFADSLRVYFDSLEIASPKTDLYSCVTASRYPSETESIRDLASKQWAKAVRFRETIEAMYADGVRIFVECGPRGNLASFVDDNLAGRKYAA